MDESNVIDAYCERVGLGIWDEPLNAVTNLAFVLAGLWVWMRGRGVVPVQVLGAVIVAIGIGSGLWHTLARPWTGAADVLPIVIYVLTYVYFANRYYCGMSVPWSAAGTVGFLPYAAATIPVFNMVPGVGGSAAYMPVPLLIAIYAVLLRKRLPEVARGLGIGVAILMVSLAMRILDEPICDALPIGTHFLWHVLNAIMLGWMAEVLRRHLAGGGRGR